MPAARRGWLRAAMVAGVVGLAVVVGIAATPGRSGTPTLPGGGIPSAVAVCAAPLTSSFGPVFCGPDRAALNRNAWAEASAYRFSADPNHFMVDGRVTRRFLLWTLCGDAMESNEVVGKEVSEQPSALLDDRDVWAAFAAYYGWSERSLPVARMRRDGCFGVYPAPPGP